MTTFAAVHSSSPEGALIYLSRYLDQETAKEPLRSSNHAVICYYQSNHSKVEAIPVSALPK